MNDVEKDGHTWRYEGSKPMPKAFFSGKPVKLDGSRSCMGMQVWEASWRCALCGTLGSAIYAAEVEKPPAPGSRTWIHDYKNECESIRLAEIREVLET
jgi:hypothetical protein